MDNITNHSIKGQAALNQPEVKYCNQICRTRMQRKENYGWYPFNLLKHAPIFFPLLSVLFFFSIMHCYFFWVEINKFRENLQFCQPFSLTLKSKSLFFKKIWFRFKSVLNIKYNKKYLKQLAYIIYIY